MPIRDAIPRRISSRHCGEETKRILVSALSPLCLHYLPKSRKKWIQRRYRVDTCFHSQMTYVQLTVKDPMPGKPFQSCFIPHQDEIAALQSQKPKVIFCPKNGEHLIQLDSVRKRDFRVEQKEASETWFSSSRFAFYQHLLGEYLQVR
jgi:hypothetical protein